VEAKPEPILDQLQVEFFGVTTKIANPAVTLSELSAQVKEAFPELESFLFTSRYEDLQENEFGFQWQTAKAFNSGELIRICDNDQLEEIYYTHKVVAKNADEPLTFRVFAREGDVAWAKG
jgi:hypothetical protein